MTVRAAGAAVGGIRQATRATPARAESTDSREQELREKVSTLVNERFGGDYQKAFRAYDANQDGQVDRAGLQTMLRDARVGSGMTRGLWADGIMDRFDTNRSRGIDWREFQGGLNR